MNVLTFGIFYFIFQSIYMCSLSWLFCILNHCYSGHPAMCFYVWPLPIVIRTNNHCLRNWKYHVEIDYLLTIILYLMENTINLLFISLKEIMKFVTCGYLWFYSYAGSVVNYVLVFVWTSCLLFPNSVSFSCRSSI